MSTETTIEPITVDNVTDFAVEAGYFERNGHSGYVRIAADILIGGSKKSRKDFEMSINTALDMCNERRRASHRLHHFYATDLADAARLVKVARFAGILPAEG